MQKKKFLIIAATGIFTLSIFIAVAATGQMMGGGMMGKGSMCGMMERAPKTGVNPESLPDANSNEAKNYVKFCSQCHALPSPERNSAGDWKELVDRMDERMRMMTRIGGGMMSMTSRGRVKAMSGSEKNAIVRYLQNNALKTLDRSKVTSLDTLEYRAFERVCSQCHDLPDPSIHTKSQWPQVVRKMKESMKEMSVTPPSVEEEKSIIKFLQNNAEG